MLRLTWDEVADATEKLGTRIKDANFSPDYLVGITLGGLVPLMLLGKQLKNRNVLTISAQSYDGDKKRELDIKYLPDVNLTGKSVLLIDEVADSGDTLAAISQILREKYNVAQLKTAVVVSKHHSAFTPDFYVLSTNEWVVFPWEKVETPELSQV